MMNFSRKLAMSAIPVLLVAAPAAAADLIPYESGYLPEQYGSGPGSTYGPDAGYGPYGAAPNDCDPSSDQGSQGLCVLGQPKPEAVLPNRRYGSYPYQGSYRPSDPLTGAADRYNEYPDQRDQPGRPLPENAPDGYSGQRHDGSNGRAYGNYPAHTDDASAQPGYRSATQPIPTGAKSGPYAYEQDRPPPYAGYPAQRGYGPAAPIVPGEPSRRAYEPGSQPSTASPSEPPYERYSY